jgi:hypothetical protein
MMLRTEVESRSFGHSDDACVERKETIMNETLPGAAPAVQASAEELITALQRVLQESEEPLTVPKIRSQLSVPMRSLDIEEPLRRQAAANVFQVYPKYRSQHERYWDRPMPVHVAALIQGTLAEGSLGTSELRRKLPAYAQGLFETVLQEQIAQGKVFRHPKLGRVERVGIRPADPKEYLRPELTAVFKKLEPLGFQWAQLREGALELLHEEEWASPPAPPAAQVEIAPQSQSGPSANHPA